MPNIKSEPYRRKIEKPETREPAKPDPAGCPICGTLLQPVAGLLRCAKGHTPYLFGTSDHRGRDGGHVLPSRGSDEQSRAFRPLHGNRYDQGLRFDE